MKRKLGVGEVDQKHHVKVYVPTKVGGMELVWVRIKEGTKDRGVGIIDSEPLNAEYETLKGNIRRLKLGDVIEYDGGSHIIRPKFVRKRHVRNQKQALLNEVAQNLKEAMLFNPKVL